MAAGAIPDGKDWIVKLPVMSQPTGLTVFNAVTVPRMNIAVDTWDVEYFQSFYLLQPWL